MFIQIQTNSWPAFYTLINFTYINMYTFCLKLKMVSKCYMKMLKWLVWSCVALLNTMLFVDLGVGKIFYSSTMLEFDHDDGICF